MTIYKMTDDVLEDVKGQSWMDVGIHENVELVDIAVETSKNGNPFIAFYFENERGEKASKTEWEVNASKPIDQMDEKEKAIYLSRIKNQMARISTIAKQFIDKKELLFESPDFKTFIETIKLKLENSYKGIKLRIKIIYDYNDWATLPSYTKYTWIEKMDEIPTDKSKIKIINSVDKLVKTNSRPDRFEKDENPLIESTTADAGTNNIDPMPF